jgi:hypothetical protein
MQLGSDATGTFILTNTSEALSNPPSMPRVPAHDENTQKVMMNNHKQEIRTEA